MIKKTIFSFIFLGIGVILLAQPGKVQETWQESYEKAEALMLQQSYYNAAELYKKTIKYRKNDMELVYKAAEAYRLGRNYQSASNYYKRLMRLVNKNQAQGEYPLLGFKLGQMLKQANKYDEAEEAFFVFKSEYKGVDADKYKELAAIEMEGIKLTRKSIASKLKLKNTKVAARKINSKYTEFAPTPYGENQLVYSSLKSNEMIEPNKRRVMSKIYIANIENEERPTEIKEFNRTINTDGTHVGHSAFSKDGNRIYYTVCEYDIEENRVKCQIYMAEKGGTNWRKSVRLGESVNSEGYESTTPHITTNNSGNDVLYYASNRPGGTGGLDIWVTTRDESGSFSAPINLGNKINTVGDETTPYFDDAIGYEDPRPILYFSSTGHPGYGGFDVFRAFKTNINFTQWSDVENLGQNLNTETDEMYFILNEAKNKAYFVSNRIGGMSVKGRTCCDDIFTADVADPKEPVIIIADASGLVFDDKNKVIPNARVTIYRLDGNNARKKIAAYNTQITGYLFENIALDKDYLLVMEKDGYQKQEYQFNTKGLEESKVFRKDFYIKKTEKPKEPEEDAALFVKGVVYSDKGAAGRTYLNNADVEIIRIHPKSGKQVSFKTLRTSDQGNFSTKLPIGYRYKFIGSEPNHLSASTSINAVNITGNETRNVELVLRTTDKDVTFKIENIYYDFDSAKLRDESIPNLQVLLNILNDNPTIVIELGSHTDSKGSDAYNLGLSQRRAESVVEWLVAQGVPSSRLVAKGYGETSPVAPNTNPDGSDNPDGRQLNRRTEFKLISQ